MLQFGSQLNCDLRKLSTCSTIGSRLKCRPKSIHSEMLSTCIFTRIVLISAITTLQHITFPCFDIKNARLFKTICAYALIIHPPGATSPPSAPLSVLMCVCLREPAVTPLVPEPSVREGGTSWRRNRARPPEAGGRGSINPVVPLRSRLRSSVCTRGGHGSDSVQCFQNGQRVTVS